ncbi:hypothetical protein D3C85_1920730 [compost metagenome]
MLGGALAELVDVDGDDIRLLRVIDGRLFAEGLQVLEHLPEAGHFLRVGVDGVLPGHGHGA